MSSKIVRFPINIDQTICTEIANGLLTSLATTVTASITGATECAPSVAAIIASTTTEPTYKINASNIGSGVGIFDVSTYLPTSNCANGKTTITYKHILASDNTDNILYVTQDNDYVYLNTKQSGDPEANARTNLTLNGGIEQESTKVKITDFSSLLYSPILHNAKIDDTIGKILIKCDSSFHPDVEISIGVISNGSNGTNTLYKEALVKKIKAPCYNDGMCLDIRYGSFFYDKTFYIDNAFTDKDIYLFLHTNGIPAYDGVNTTGYIDYGGELSVVVFFDRGGHKQYAFGGIKDSYSSASISSDAIWSYNLKTDVLTKCRSLSVGRSECMQVQTGIASYIIGGRRDETQLYDVDKFTFSTEINAAQVSSTSYGIYNGCSTSHKNYGCLLFGQTSSTVGNNQIYKFDYSTNVSSSNVVATDVRINAASAAENYNSSNIIYAYGGYSDISGLGIDPATFNTLYKFNVTTTSPTYSVASTSSHARSNCDMQAGFNTLYIYGGYMGNHITLTDSILEVALPSETFSESTMHLTFEEKLVSQCSKMNSNKSEIIIISNKSVQKINIINSTVSVRTEMNVLDADTDMVCATSHLI